MIWGAIFGKKDVGSEEGESRGKAWSQGLASGMTAENPKTIKTVEEAVAKITEAMQKKFDSVDFKETGKSMMTKVEDGV